MKIATHSTMGAALLSLSLSCVVHAKDYGDGRESLAPSLLLQNASQQNDHWQGIGRLQVNAQYPEAYCTASLIDTRTGESASGPAYVLTSGHCISMDSVNVVAGEPSNGHIDFNYFHDTAERQHRYPLKQVNWSSQRGLDLAVLELDARLETLMQAGIEPLQLASGAPAIGDELLIVGAPSQYPEQGLRLSTCSHLGSKSLIEQPTVRRSFYKDQCLGLKPGNSGSPLLERHSNQILGVVSTTSADALEDNRCFENAPCELVDGQPQWSADTNYSSPGSVLQHCFANGTFTADAEGCDLLPSTTLGLRGKPVLNQYRRVKEDATGNQILPTWKMAFSLDTPFYRYKTVRDPLLCLTPTDYSAALTSTEALINDPVGPEPGIHVLCIVGVNAEDQAPTYAMLKNPLLMAMEIAAPSPTQAPRLTIAQVPEGDYKIAYTFSHPVLSAYEAKHGAPDDTDCDDPLGYVRQQPILEIAASELPVKLCTKAFDMSGQRSLPRMDVLSQ